MAPTFLHFILAGSIGGIAAGIICTRTRIGTLMCGASGAVVMGWVR